MVEENDFSISKKILLLDEALKSTITPNQLLSLLDIKNHKLNPIDFLRDIVFKSEHSPCLVFLSSSWKIIGIPRTFNFWDFQLASENSRITISKFCENKMRYPSDVKSTILASCSIKWNKNLYQNAFSILDSLCKSLATFKSHSVQILETLIRKINPSFKSKVSVAPTPKPLSKEEVVELLTAYPAIANYFNYMVKNNYLHLATTPVTPTILQNPELIQQKEPLCPSQPKVVPIVQQKPKETQPDLCATKKPSIDLNKDDTKKKETVTPSAFYKALERLKGKNLLFKSKEENIPKKPKINPPKFPGFQKPDQNIITSNPEVSSGRTPFQRSSITPKQTVKSPIVESPSLFRSPLNPNFPNENSTVTESLLVQNSPIETASTKSSPIQSTSIQAIQDTRKEKEPEDFQAELVLTPPTCAPIVDDEEEKKKQPQVIDTTEEFEQLFNEFFTKELPTNSKPGELVIKEIDVSESEQEKSKVVEQPFVKPIQEEPKVELKAIENNDFEKSLVNEEPIIQTIIIETAPRVTEKFMLPNNREEEEQVTTPPQVLPNELTLTQPPEDIIQTNIIQESIVQPKEEEKILLDIELTEKTRAKIANLKSKVLKKYTLRNDKEKKKFCRELYLKQSKRLIGFWKQQTQELGRNPTDQEIQSFIVQSQLVIK